MLGTTTPFLTKPATIIDMARPSSITCANCNRAANANRGQGRLHAARFGCILRSVRERGSLPEERGITCRTFVAFVAFQFMAALEAEGGANAGVEEFLPQ